VHTRAGIVAQGRLASFSRVAPAPRFEYAREMTEQRVVLVTGAAGNLGEAVCARLSGAGQRVVRVERARATFEGKELASVDLGSGPATRELMAQVARQLGRLDAVVHTVGTFRPSGPVESWDGEALRALFDTNVVTSAHVLAGALSVLRPLGRGQVVLVASTAALHGSAGAAAYSASKAAQLRLVESAAAELAGTQIGISAVLPGTMDTPPNRAAMPDADRSRWVTLEEVSEVIAFLASPAGLVLSGQALKVARE
jgi:NAD(P)-dependent dehydrogenase (short-subunit alcohol dehydrogenase family)